jgi:hypothetical protein
LPSVLFGEQSAVEIIRVTLEQSLVIGCGYRHGIQSYRVEQCLAFSNCSWAYSDGTTQRTAQPKMTEHEEAGWLASPAEPTSPDWDRSGPDPTHHQTLARSLGRRRLALLLPTAQPLRRRLLPPLQGRHSRLPPGRGSAPAPPPAPRFRSSGTRPALASVPFSCCAPETYWVRQCRWRLTTWRLPAPGCYGLLVLNDDALFQSCCQVGPGSMQLQSVGSMGIRDDAPSRFFLFFANEPSSLRIREL